MATALRVVASIFGVIVLGGMGSNHIPRTGRQCNADFKILTDKRVYSPGSTVHVKFTVTNTNAEPLYLFRGMNQCSSQIGTFSLLILDESGREVNTSGCSVEVDLSEMDLEKELRSPRSGIMLKSAEIYRVEANFKLPSKKGVYRLKAQAIPAAITSEQSEKLVQKGLRVLQGNCAAPVAVVEIR